MMIPRTDSLVGSGRPFRIGLRGLLRLWLVAFGVATLFGVLAVLTLYLGFRASSRPVVLISAANALIDWYVWALITPPIVLLAQRFPIRRDRWKAQTALHLALGLAVSIAELTVFLILARGWFRLIGRSPEFPWPEAYAITLGQWLPSALLVYVIIVIAVHAVDYARRYRVQELQASRLETQLAQAQLHVLKAQLHPHFLFNTLHTIAVFVREGRREEGVRMISGLADLLRHSLDHGARQKVPLKEELEFVETYLAIERIRLGDRLDVSTRIEPEALDALVPSLILQPLVENAVRHGVAPHGRPGRIDIRACPVHGQLHVTITDSGDGFREGEPATDREHLGLRNTRDRLSRHYGDNARLVVGNAPAGGAEVMLVLPWEEASSRRVDRRESREATAWMSGPTAR